MRHTTVFIILSAIIIILCVVGIGLIFYNQNPKRFYFKGEDSYKAGNYIQAIEERQGLMVACLEEVAYKLGFIDAEKVRQAAERMKNNSYGQYLFGVLEDGPGPLGI